MFLSEIAKNFNISKTKVSYMVVLGLAEYFYNSLINLAKQFSFFSESINQKLNLLDIRGQWIFRLDFFKIFQVEKF